MNVSLFREMTKQWDLHTRKIYKLIFRLDKFLYITASLKMPNISPKCAKDVMYYR
jgi:hypothetical protein